MKLTQNKQAIGMPYDYECDFENEVYTDAEQYHKIEQYNKHFLYDCLKDAIKQLKEKDLIINELTELLKNYDNES